jgi:hypothetical protein
MTDPKLTHDGEYNADLPPIVCPSKGLYGAF